MPQGIGRLAPAGETWVEFLAPNSGPCQGLAFPGISGFSLLLSLLFIMYLSIYPPIHNSETEGNMFTALSFVSYTEFPFFQI